jgi:alanine racemase
LQHNKFQQFVEEIHSKWGNNIIIHTGNSAASIRYPSDMYNYIRFGIGLYGLYPSKFVKQQKLINLKQAMNLYSRLAHVKLLGKGESVSYGRTYKTTSDEWIGSIGLGYADGFNRKLRGQEVIIDGKRMPIVGTICMDQLMIKLDK